MNESERIKIHITTIEFELARELLKMMSLDGVIFITRTAKRKQSG